LLILLQLEQRGRSCASYIGDWGENSPRLGRGPSKHLQTAVRQRKKGNGGDRNSTAIYGKGEGGAIPPLGRGGQAGGEASENQLQKKGWKDFP